MAAAPTMIGDDLLNDRFERLYRAHYGCLVSFFGRRGLDPETSRDLAQETMLRAYKGLADLKAEAAAGSWVRTIAANVWNTWVRDEHVMKRRHEESSLDEAERDGLQVGDDRGLWPRQEESPERRLVEEEHMAAALAELTPRQEKIMGLWLEGRSYSEIAGDLGVSIQTVRSSLSRARGKAVERLRLRLYAEDHSPRGNE